MCEYQARSVTSPRRDSCEGNSTFPSGEEHAETQRTAHTFQADSGVVCSSVFTSGNLGAQSDLVGTSSPHG